MPKGTIGTRIMTKGSAQAKTKSEDHVNKFVSTRIHELRNGRSYGDFAAESGVHQAAIREWETCRPPCLSILESMATRLKVPVDTFFPAGKVPRDYPRFSGDIA